MKAAVAQFISFCFPSSFLADNPEFYIRRIAQSMEQEPIIPNDLSHQGDTGSPQQNSNCSQKYHSGTTNRLLESLQATYSRNLIPYGTPCTTWGRRGPIYLCGTGRRRDLGTDISARADISLPLSSPDRFIPSLQLQFSMFLKEFI